MPRENLTQKRERAAEIERRMFEHYGEGACSLDHVDPFTLTVAVILSAQCTDAAVNKDDTRLFARFGTPEAMAAASIEDIEAIIHPLGFFRSKAKNLKAWCANGAWPNLVAKCRVLWPICRSFLEWGAKRQMWLCARRFETLRASLSIRMYSASPISWGLRRATTIRLKRLRRSS